MLRQGLFRFSYIFLSSFSCVIHSSLSPCNDVSEYIYCKCRNTYISFIPYHELRNIIKLKANLPVSFKKIIFLDKTFLDYAQNLIRHIQYTGFSK